MGTRKGQLALRLPQRGGKREGAGRKRRGGRKPVPHRRRPELSGREPAHVTWRIVPGLPSLRSAQLREVVQRLLQARDGTGAGAAAGGAVRPAFRVAEWSIQPDHVHLVVESVSRRALTAGLRGLGVSLARRVNRALGRRGAVLVERFHLHVLRALQEVVNAVRYVRENTARHAARPGGAWRRRTAPGWIDPWSSAPLARRRPVTWLLGRALSLVDGAG